MSHAGAADGLNQSFLDDAFLNVQGELAAALLRSTPAYTMSQAADILNLLGLYPLALFWNWSWTMVYFFCNASHVFNMLIIINHFVFLSSLIL